MLVLLTQFLGALLGMLAIIFGAFGAHALQKKHRPASWPVLKLG